MNWHNRPYSCKAVGCERVGKFIRITDLERHQNEVHNQQNDIMEFRCPYISCQHSCIGKGYSRRDALERHPKAVHHYVKTNTENDKDRRNSATLPIPLPEGQRQPPVVQSSQTPTTLPIPLPDRTNQPPIVHPTRSPSDVPDNQSQHEELLNPGRKRSRQVEIDDEGGTGLDTTEVSNAEIKRLKQVIEDQERKFVERRPGKEVEEDN